MTAIEELNAAIGNLQSAVTAENTELASLVTSLQTVQQQLTDLQSQIAAGGAVTADQLNEVTQQVAAITDSANAAVAAATGPAPTP